ncbi:winged helix DNA-binding protein [Rhodocytophaga aerolata]|uniref:Winged helix DNA-binding protein n=1 Tax=Rhodocytophaga aerolata TaxID=455078 RepID=A0ABT8R7L4_9BACT|nr:winged helix DNA-binding protein [Rhodocytophaga aerolata]MDO1448094.1 winged helix DNA-binding protein [Rhodocytophaga aerolata]
MKYTLVKQLIELAEQYESENPENSSQNLVDFTAWLNGQLMQKKPGDTKMAGRLITPYETVESVLGKLITFLYRYARIYSKKSLENTPLITPDDFTYLAIVFSRGSMTKMEVIESHMQEKTTGMEILKRLLKNGLIEQYDDETDKRSKRLVVTQKGQQVLMGIFPSMGYVASLISGNLTTEEKMQLVYLLNKLHLFHQNIYQESRYQHPEDILKERLPDKYNT